MQIQIEDEYLTLARRKIRNFYLRLQPDGSAQVSVPEWATLAQIEAFVRPRIPWLQKQRAALSAQRAESAAPFTDGRTLWLFGRRYTLHIVPNNTPGLVFCADAALLYCPPGLEETERRKLVENVYAQQLQTYLAGRWAVYSIQMSLQAQYTVRLMHTRWGSCTPSTARIRFNLRLAQKPEPWIDYVIVHELAHLRHADHSPSFWALVERYIPNCREIRQALNSGSFESL